MKTNTKTFIIVVVTSVILLLTTIAASADEIHEAAKDGNIAKIKSILKKTPDAINKRDTDYKTPLHYAFINKNKPLVIFLINNGANVNIEDDYMDFNAEYKNRKEKIRKGCRNYPIHYAVLNNWKDIIELLLSKGADVNQKNSGVYTPVCIAIIEQNSDMLDYLLSKKAAIDFSFSGITPLCIAAETGNKEIVRTLLSKGVSYKAVESPVTSDCYT